MENFLVSSPTQLAQPYNYDDSRYMQSNSGVNLNNDVQSLDYYDDSLENQTFIQQQQQYNQHLQLQLQQQRQQHQQQQTQSSNQSLLPLPQHQFQQNQSLSFPYLPPNTEDRQEQYPSNQLQHPQANLFPYQHQLQDFYPKHSRDQDHLDYLPNPNFQSDSGYNQKLNDPNLESENEIVPVSTKLPDNKVYVTDESGFGINIYDTNHTSFQHSRNISLDGVLHILNQPHNYHNNNNQLQQQQQPYYRSHQYTDSIASISQDPPIGQIGDMLPQSISSNTLYSLDSVPSFESPLHQQHHHQQQQQQPQQQQQQQQQHHHNQLFPTSQAQHFTTTPRRVGRNKSASISMYTTPSRVGHPGLSPVNLAASTFASSGANNSNSNNNNNNSSTNAGNSSSCTRVNNRTPANKVVKGHSRTRSRVSLDAAAAALASKTNSASSYNPTLNPFYTPSQFTQRSFDEHEDDLSSTPLVTPGYNKLKQSHSTFFSPIRNDAFDALDDDETDAVTQLKKAKSYSSLARRHQKRDSLHRPHSQMNSLSENILSGPLLSSQKATANDYQQQLQPHLQQGHKIDLLLPEFEDNQSLNYGVYDKSITTNLSQSVSPYNKHKRAPQPQSQPQVNLQYPSASVNLNASFTITQSEEEHFTSNGNSPAATTTTTATTTNTNTNTTTTTPNLLPPMATFSNTSLQRSSKDESVYFDNAKKPSSSKNNRKNKSSGGSVPKSVKSLKSLLSSSSSSGSDGSISSLQDVVDEDGTVTIAIPSDLHVTRPTVRNNRSDKNDKVDPKKKHKCPICESRFQRPEHVKRHLKSHSSEKPFQCDEPDCGKCFNRKDNLKAHLKKIHGIIRKPL